MSTGKLSIGLGCLMVAGLVGATSDQAKAGGFGFYYSHGPTYVAPAPVYVAPAPVYVPPPVVYTPPVVVAPAPVYCPPPVVYSQPLPVYRSYGGFVSVHAHGRHHHRGVSVRVGW